MIALAHAKEETDNEQRKKKKSLLQRYVLANAQLLYDHTEFEQLTIKGDKK